MSYCACMFKPSINHLLQTKYVGSIHVQIWFNCMIRAIVAIEYE
jgi:hypothetical protein